MELSEAIGRRYCAFRGEDPDQIMDGKPVWQLALEDVRVSLNAQETFHIETGQISATGSNAFFSNGSDDTQMDLELAVPYGLRVCR